MKSIDNMHKHWGRYYPNKCGDCSNLIRRQWDKTYFKCARYGLSHCASTDWALSWAACGKFNKPLEPNERPLVEWAVRQTADGGEIEGQMEL